MDPAPGLKIEGTRAAQITNLLEIVRKNDEFVSFVELLASYEQDVKQIEAAKQEMIQSNETSASMSGNMSEISSAAALSGNYVAKQIGSPSENELKIANFMRQQGFNDAGVAAILSNLQHESNFNPGSVDQGDGADGSDSIGIVQWNSGRAKNLKNFCAQNGFGSWASLEGQMNFLIHELKKDYSHVYNFMKSVPNTAEGASAAALKWAAEYEVCAVQYRAERGVDAANVWFPRYANKAVPTK